MRMQFGTGVGKTYCRGNLDSRWLRAVGGMVLCAVSLCTLLFTSVPAGAQEGNRDYYAAKLSADSTQLLRNAELYHIEPGVARMRSGSYGAAYDDFVFILNFFPNHPRVLVLLSDLCDTKWKDVRCEAEPWFQKAIARNPNIAQTYVVYGLHLQRVSQLQQAIQNYDKALALNPSSANAHYNLGLAYFDKKQFEEANRHAQMSYALGMPLPGLRDKLTRAGKWQPMTPDQLSKELQPPASESPATKPQ